MGLLQAISTPAKFAGLSAAKFAGLAALGGAAFAKGVGSADLSSAMYEFASGDPDIDKYVFGTDIGIRGLMAPLPWETATRDLRGFNRTMLQRHMGARRSGYYDERNQNTMSTYNRTTGRNTGAGVWNNTMPQVQGDMVFGQYNMRMR